MHSVHRSRDRGGIVVFGKPIISTREQERDLPRLIRAGATAGVGLLGKFTHKANEGRSIAVSGIANLDGDIGFALVDPTEVPSALSLDLPSAIAPLPTQVASPPVIVHLDTGQIAVDVAVPQGGSLSGLPATLSPIFRS